MIDIIASQLPLASEYTQVARMQWENSRHSVNFHDVVRAAQKENLTNREKIAVGAGLLGVSYALGPFNESTLGAVAGNVIKHTENIAVGIASVPPTTGVMEAAAALGMAYVVNKFTSATDIIRNRYISVKENSETESNSPGRLRKLARTLGIVAATGTGASGVALDHALHDHSPEGREKRTRRAAFVGAGMLMVINAGYATVLLGGAKGVEAVGPESATDGVVDFISNPLYVGGTLLGLMALRQQYNLLKYRLRQRGRAKTENVDELPGNQQTITNLAKPEDITTCSQAQNTKLIGGVL